ncbi:MAG: vanadium-dependent haloperoxidase [Gemmatimonadaceae bacterium]|nr:vanadium-dependent haloperoxidase [Chitinophagaceae bacterium]
MMKYVMVFAMATIAGFSCKQPGDYTKFTKDPLLYCKTVKKLNNVVLDNNFPPMIASRNYAYANIAAYECIAAGDSSYNSLSGQIKHLPAMPKPVAGSQIDFQLAALLSFTRVGNAVTFPEGSLMAYYDELKQKVLDAGMPEEILASTVAFSDTIVSSIMAWSKKDNYAQTRSASKFTVRDEDGRWVPTPPMYGSAVEPHWMEVRPFVLDSPSQCKPVRPPVFDVANKKSAFHVNMTAIKNIGDSLTEEQKDIADFWDDNPFKLNVSGHVQFATKKFSPAGHWMNIVGIAAKEAKADFNTTVAAYAQTSIALFDGFISCWDEKFRSNYIRPETAINKYIDQNWQPYIQTPPFPSYTSGHSTISAAAAETMTNFFGDKLSFTDTSSLEFGLKSRKLNSFREAAKEAGMSRLYGGIHYSFDNEAGAISGTNVGKIVIARLKMKK